MKVSKQSKLYVKRDKILNIPDDPYGFYLYFQNLITDLNDMIAKMRSAINYESAVGEFFRTTDLTPAAASTWKSMVWSSQTVVDNRIKLQSGDKEIKVDSPGWYLITYNAHVENTQGSSLRATTALRLTVNDSEVGGSEAIQYIDKSDGDISTIGGISTLVKLSAGDIVELQYYIGDTDLIFSGDETIFDSATAASMTMVQLETT